MDLREKGEGVSEVLVMDPPMVNAVVRLSDKYKTHFNIMKLTGVVSMILILSASLGISVSNLKCDVPTKETVKYNAFYATLNTTDTALNFSSCDLLTSYDLPDDFVVSLCKRKMGIEVDLRRYTNKTPTLDGVTLNYRQWEYLYRISGIIHNRIQTLS